MTPQLEHKTQKVLDMTVDGLNIFCIFHYDETQNPYHLFCKWYEYHGDRDYGWHRKQVARYQNMIGVLDHIRNFVVKQEKKKEEN